ncbi:tRNA (mnm(5)s(2)U34)-methyltransferase [Simkania sp.]|uniref:tRNA (mnm(5)s(2)U34)-methyltransferase n=1 Tax=Simkania sp. TaxID=34094 RepID=UPI003B52E76E
MIDATCGNGHDSLALAQMVAGNVLCIDIQEQAINATREKLKKFLTSSDFKNISYHLGSYTHFPPLKAAPSLIVYNLGYLPGSDKTVVTVAQETLVSLQEAITLLKPGGSISLTCYVRHSGGKEEEEALLSFSKSLDKNEFGVCYHQWINRLKSPSLLLIQKLNN